MKLQTISTFASRSFAGLLLLLLPMGTGFAQDQTFEGVLVYRMEPRQVLSISDQLDHPTGILEDATSITRISLPVIDITIRIKGDRVLQTSQATPPFPGELPRNILCMEDDCFLIDHKARTYTQNKRVITALTPNIAGTTREVPGDTIIEGYSCRKVIFEIEPLEDRPEIQAYAWISRDLRLPKWKRGDTEVGLMSIDAGEEGTILFLSMEIAGAMKLAFHLVSAHPEILEDEIFSIPEGYTQVD